LALPDAARTHLEGAPALERRRARAFSAARPRLIARFGPAEIDLGFFDLAVLALASFRLTHLVTDDKIFDFVRALFFDERGGRLTKAQRGWRRVVCEVIECLWCAGLWSALFCITIYFLGFWGVFIDLLLAVAGLGSLLAVVSKAVAGRT
jgi:hypothetical protein